MKHGTLYCARRGMPGKKPCPCDECRPVRRSWETERLRAYRHRRQRQLAAENPAAYPFECMWCGLPFTTNTGRGFHQERCRV